MKRKVLLIKSVVVAIFLLLCVDLSLFADDNLKRNKAEEHFQKALAFYEKGSQDSAIEQLNIALNLDRTFAKAYNQLALIYMNEGTVYGRSQATYAIEKALKLEPRNIEFLFNEALLNLKKSFTRAAEKQFKKIIELDPRNHLTYYHLAQLKEDAMLHYQNMISVEPGTGGIIFLDSFAKKLYEQAADYYKQAISVNPKFSTAYYRLALIFYEFDNFDQMVQLLESAVKIIPNDKNCHLFLGFAYQKNGDYNLAADEYELAKELMSPSEIEGMESIDFLLTSEGDERYKLISEPEKKRLHRTVWTSKDPFYLTEINERELEHFSRVAYANLRFSRPEKNIEGWQTDAGKVLIRYGEPDYKYRTRPYLGTFVGNGRNPLHHSKEIWIYPNFDFIFEDRYLSNNYSFAWGHKPETDYKDMYNRMIEDFPDYYKLIPDSQAFSVPYDIVAFQGQSGKTELEVCYGIPLSALNSRRVSNNEFMLSQGVFFFDDSWNPVVKKMKQLSFRQFERSLINSDSFYCSNETINIKPGNYQMALEFQDEKSGKRSRAFREFEVDSFFSDKFQMSDILFAASLEPPNLNIPPSRSDFKFGSNPIRVYKIGQPIVIYYEIYNLTQDNRGETHFKIEYRIGTDYQSKSPLKKFLTNIGIIKRVGEVTAGYEYTGNSAVELQYQNIVLAPDMVGEIVITLKSTDLLTGNTTERREKFTVVE